MTVEFCHGLAALEDLKAAWNSLHADVDPAFPFLDHQWIFTWARHYDADSDIIIGVAHENGRLIGAMPLRRCGGDLEFLGDPNCADYMDALYSPDREEVLEEIAVAVIRQVPFRRWRLGRLVQRGTTAACLASLYARQGIPFREFWICANPVLELPDSAETLLAAVPKPLRRDVRATERALENLGGARFCEYDSGREAEAIADALARFHLDRQADKKGKSIFANERDLAFYTRVLPSVGSAIGLRASSIEANGKIISASLSLVRGKTLFYWIPSFDASIPKVSLGKFHIFKLIEAAIKEGIRRFDFMIGDERYKHQWTRNGYDCSELVAYRSSSSRALDIVKYSVRRRVRRVLEVLRG